MGKDFDFVKDFEEHKEGLTREEILEKVRHTEKYYRRGDVIGKIIFFTGLIFIILGPDFTKGLFMALLAGISGLVIMMHTKIWMHVRLYHLYNLWVSINRFEAEILKSEAADL